MPTGTSAPDTLNGGSGTDHIDGGAGNDYINGHAGDNHLYGGAGNDTFVISLKDLEAGATNYIQDFAGAGGYNAGANDFLALTGFSAGSTMTATTIHAPDAHGYVLITYTLHDAATNADYTFLLNSLSTKVLGAGDFQWYA